MPTLQSLFGKKTALEELEESVKKARALREEKAKMDWTRWAKELQEAMEKSNKDRHEREMLDKIKLPDWNNPCPYPQANFCPHCGQRLRNYTYTSPYIGNDPQYMRTTTGTEPNT